MTNEAMDDSTAYDLLKLTLAAHDDTYTFWPKESVEFARGQWKKHQGEVPSIEAVAQHIGIKRTDEFMDKIVEWRKFDNLLKGYKKPCYYCSSEQDLVYFDFALMRISEAKREYSATLASAAMSAIAIPIIGFGALKLPGKSITGAAYHMKLVVCKPCSKKEGNMFGLFMMNEKRAAKHPLWNTLQDAGFMKFLEQEKMPEPFRMDFGQHL